ncbi:MAG: magnesium/cobalt transporter CorA [Actinomycetota bacterium]
MITSRVFVDGKATDERVDPSDARDVLARDDAFLWLDSMDPTDEDLAVLQAAFGLHPLTIEDVKHRHQRPKVEIFQDHAFVVLRPIELTDGSMIEKELHAFVGKRFIVTLRPSPAYDIAEITSRWERQPELFREGGGYAIYVLIDEVVDDYLSAVERFEDDVDELEDEVFSDDEHSGRDSAEVGDVQQHLFQVKREVVRLRRFAMPVRQGLDLLQERPEIATPPLGPYFRDVMDHVIRVVELADNIRDLLTSLLEVRVAQAANRLNDIMKRVTSWGAVILVPTMVAGIYGMNFRHMPELGWRYGYPLALVVMFGTAAGVWWFFRRKDWL